MLKLTGENKLADLATTHDRSLDLTARNSHQPETEILTHRGQPIHSSDPIVAQRKCLTDPYFGRRGSSHQVAKKLFRGLLSEVTSKRKDEHLTRASTCKTVKLQLRCVQATPEPFRSEDLSRVGLERDDQQGEIEPASPLTRLGQEILVPEVHTIERPNRDEMGTTRDLRK
jgi:hypothetical protein